MASAWMVLCHLEMPNARLREDDLYARLAATGIAAQELPRLVSTPEGMSWALQNLSDGRLQCEIRHNGRVSELIDALERGRAVVVFMPARALRRPYRRHGIPRNSYQPVFVTGVRGRRIFFHDPDPQRGGGNRSLRRGVHSYLVRWIVLPFPFLQWHTFERIWGGSQRIRPLSLYLTLKFPAGDKPRSLESYVFLEAWALERTR